MPRAGLGRRSSALERRGAQNLHCGKEPAGSPARRPDVSGAHQADSHRAHTAVQRKDQAAHGYGAAASAASCRARRAGGRPCGAPLWSRGSGPAGRPTALWHLRRRRHPAERSNGTSGHGEDGGRARLALSRHVGSPCADARQSQGRPARRGKTCAKADFYRHSRRYAADGGRHCGAARRGLFAAEHAGQRAAPQRAAVAGGHAPGHGKL